MFEAPPLAHCFSSDHEDFRRSLRDFVSREIAPHVNERTRLARLRCRGTSVPRAWGFLASDTRRNRVVRPLTSSAR